MYIHLYNNVTVCIFIGCSPWSIKGDTYRWRQIHVRSRQETCFVFFVPEKSLNKPFGVVLYKRNRFPFVCTVIDHRDVTACKEQQSRHSTSSHVVLFLFFIRCYVICDLLQNTHGKSREIPYHAKCKRIQSCIELYASTAVFMRGIGILALV